MTVKPVVSPVKHQGLTVDTVAWLAANLKLPNGSTYIEVDQAQRLYKLHDGAWYLQ